MNFLQSNVLFKQHSDVGQTLFVWMSPLNHGGPKNVCYPWDY